MNLPVELFLCLRYLKPKRTFVSVITVISVLGVAIGVMVLVVVLSVMNGMGRDLKLIMLGMNSHVIVVSDEVMRDWETVAATAEKTPHVRAAAPFVVGPVMLEFRDTFFTGVIKGIEPKREKGVSDIAKYVLPGGKFDLQSDNVLVGSELARRAQIFAGDKITVAGPRVLKVAHKQDEAFLPVELTVMGIFQSGMYDYDAYFLITSLETAQEIYDVGGGVHGIGVMTDDPFGPAILQVTRTLNDQLKPPLMARTWMDENRTLFSALQVEKNVMFIIMFFISIVAGFCIMNTLVTVVVQKTREIGALKALGASDRQVLAIFTAQGFVVGVFGVASGVAAGLLALTFRNELLGLLRNVTGFELFPAKIYHFSELPSQVIPGDIVLICVLALVICTLAGLLPAWRAARLEPVEALRYE